MSLERTHVFIAWLDEQENIKGWTDNKLAVKAGISPSVLTRARQGTIPKWEACVALAIALNISPITVFRKAGLLPANTSTEASLQDWEHLLAQLPPDEQDEVRQIALMKIEKRQKSEAAARAAQFKPGKQN